MMDHTGPTDDDDETHADSEIPHDHWPIEGYDDDRRAEASYVGRLDPDGDRGTSLLFFDEREETVFEASVDETEERFVPRSETEREVGPTETLGEVLEEFGDRLGSESLSSFARNRLQDDPEQAPVSTPEAATFTRSNVSPEADHDLEFTGSYTSHAADGRVLIVERDFLVTADDADPPQTATVEVEERRLRAADDRPTDRSGDADLLAADEHRFEIEIGADETRTFEAYVEDRCREWHESRLESPA